MAFRPLFCQFLSGRLRQVSPNQITNISYHLLHFQMSVCPVNILQGYFINNSCYFKSLQALILQFLKQIIYLMNIIYCELLLSLIGIGRIMYTTSRRQTESLFTAILCTYLSYDLSSGSNITPCRDHSGSVVE